MRLNPKYERYECRLVNQSRPVGPFQALRYLWLLPERQLPTFIEILYLPVLLVFMMLTVFHEEVPAPLGLIVSLGVLALALSTCAGWYIATQIIQDRRSNGEICDRAVSREDQA